MEGGRGRGTRGKKGEGGQGVDAQTQFGTLNPLHAQIQFGNVKHPTKFGTVEHPHCMPRQSLGLSNPPPTARDLFMPTSCSGLSNSPCIPRHSSGLSLHAQTVFGTFELPPPPPPPPPPVCPDTVWDCQTSSLNSQTQFRTVELPTACPDTVRDF